MHVSTDTPLSRASPHTFESRSTYRTGRLYGRHGSKSSAVESCVDTYAAKSARLHKAKGSTPAVETTEKLGIPLRALLTLLGAFLAVLELTHVVALVPAVMSGRLRVSGVRTGYTTFYWAEQPIALSFNVLVGVAEVLVIGFIAWRCLRTAVLGRIKVNP